MRYELWPLTRLENAASSTDRFDIFFGTEKSRLEAVEAGVAPFVVSEDGETLAWGFAALRWLGLRYDESAEFPVVRVTGGAVGDTSEALILALRAEDRCDRYTLREQVELRLLAGDTDSIWSLVSSEGDPRPVIDRFMQLSYHLQEAVNGGITDLKSAEAASAVDPTIFAALMDLVKTRSFSRRRTFLVNYLELLQREDVGGSQRHVLSTLSEAPDPETALLRLRFPVLSEMESAVSAFEKKYLSGSGIRLEAPPSFEGEKYSVTFTFHTEREYERRVKTLVRAQEGVGEILDLLF